MISVKVKSAEKNKIVSKVSKKLTGKNNKITLAAAIKNATVKEFNALKSISGYTNESLAALVGITHRTIRNKKSNYEVFNIAQTERLRKLYLLFTEGNEVFGDETQFSQWLQQPAYGLDYNIPNELLKQPGGLDKILTEVNGIKYGDAI